MDGGSFSKGGPPERLVRDLHCRLRRHGLWDCLLEFSPPLIAFSYLVFAQSREYFTIIAVAGHNIYDKVLLSGRKTNPEIVSFPTTFVFVMIVAETNYSGAPHFSRVATYSLHQLIDQYCIRVTDIVLDTFNKSLDITIVFLGFVFCQTLVPRVE